MEASEIGAALRQPQAGRTIGACLEAFPALTLDAQLQPITRCPIICPLQKGLCCGNNLPITL